MSATPIPKVDYIMAARRHYADAQALLSVNRQANAGQLFGFVAECGLKALLIACGLECDTDGNLLLKTTFRIHMPLLSDRIKTMGQLIPDGRLAQSYLASVPSLHLFSNWHTDHRYWRYDELPIAAVPSWASAAMEVSKMLDQMKLNGVP